MLFACRKLTVLGAGSWGTALAILVARNGHPVLLWGHDADQMALVEKSRLNVLYLPHYSLPDNVQITSDLQVAAEYSDLILIAVPSHAFKSTLLKLKDVLANKTVKIAWATKGFQQDSGALLHEVVNQVFSSDTSAAVLSGPTFAKEVTDNLPTAITIASTQLTFANELAELVHNDRFRAYTSSDVIGVQVGGAVKNVLAIAAGIADGLGFGANTRAALITRGLNEIMRLGLCLGGTQETFFGLAGLGDLVLTCTDDQSRNRRFGLALGQGKPPEEILATIGQEIEGISAAKVTFSLAQKYGLEMPITEQTYKVLYEGLAPITAVQNLLSRDQKSEA